MRKIESQNPIMIPEDCFFEGFIKTKKSIRIESKFQGTLLSSEKVIIDSLSVFIGDMVCAELHISGHLEGNIYCAGRLTVIGNAQIKGKVFTKLFQNEENCDLNCTIYIPNNNVINAINDILSDIDSNTKLSTDINLKRITQLFKENVFSGTDEEKKIKKEIPIIEKEELVTQY